MKSNVISILLFAINLFACGSQPTSSKVKGEENGIAGQTLYRYQANDDNPTYRLSGYSSKGDSIPGDNAFTFYTFGNDPFSRAAYETPFSGPSLTLDGAGMYSVEVDFNSTNESLSGTLCSLRFEVLDNQGVRQNSGWWTQTNGELGEKTWKSVGIPIDSGAQGVSVRALTESVPGSYSEDCDDSGCRNFTPGATASCKHTIRQIRIVHTQRL